MTSNGEHLQMVIIVSQQSTFRRSTTKVLSPIFTRDSIYAIACPSVTRVGQSKTAEARSQNFHHTVAPSL